MRPLLLLLCVALPVWCQTEKPKSATPPRHPGIIKFIETKHLSGERRERVVVLAQQLFSGRARVATDPVLATLAIQADSQSDIEAVEELIKRFDIPEAAAKIRQVQLTAYLLEPGNAEYADSSRKPPAELDIAIEQLRNLFGHKLYAVVETTIMQARAGATFSTTGMLARPTSDTARSPYHVKFRSSGYDEKSEAIYVNGFSYSIRVPNGTGFADSSIETDLTIKENQKIVIGKVTKGMNENSGFIVVTAKLN
jgi:hypothetical protein